LTLLQETALCLQVRRYVAPEYTVPVAGGAGLSGLSEEVFLRIVTTGQLDDSLTTHRTSSVCTEWARWLLPVRHRVRHAAQQLTEAIAFNLYDGSEDPYGAAETQFLAIGPCRELYRSMPVSSLQRLTSLLKLMSVDVLSELGRTQLAQRRFRGSPVTGTRLPDPTAVSVTDVSLLFRPDHAAWVTPRDARILAYATVRHAIDTYATAAHPAIRTGGIDQRSLSPGVCELLGGLTAESRRFLWYTTPPHCNALLTPTPTPLSSTVNPNPIPAGTVISVWQATWRELPTLG